jgi:DNA-binding NarL/FixJ family response regulator
VLRLLVDGLSKKEIASRLDLSVHTVDNYVRRLYKKLHVNTLGGAVAKALRDGLV